MPAMASRWEERKRVYAHDFAQRSPNHALNFTNLLFARGNDIFGVNLTKLEAVLAVQFWKIET
jgi:hypothetical protein